MPTDNVIIYIIYFLVSNSLKFCQQINPCTSHKNKAKSQILADIVTPQKYTSLLSKSKEQNRGLKEGNGFMSKAYYMGMIKMEE